MALLLDDNATLVQMQPAYRCSPHPAPLLARWGNLTDGAPQRFDNVTSIFGDGASQLRHQYYLNPLPQR